jgi:site-specific recombinase XerD
MPLIRPGRSVAVRPLEALLLPPELDGSLGLNRGQSEACVISAATDMDAVNAWLSSKPVRTGSDLDTVARRNQSDLRGIGQGRAVNLPNTHTQRAYRREAERFLLWAVLHQGRPLSSMTADDCDAYLRFLADPKPRGRWCGPRACPRDSINWRPFEGPLSVPARRQAGTILKNLARYLVQQRYWRLNPWDGVEIPKQHAVRLNVHRSLTTEQWQFVQQQLEQLPKTSAHLRLKFAVRLLHATGLRSAEVVAATVDDLVVAQGWVLRVPGPRQRARELALPVALIKELGQYLDERGLSSDPVHRRNQGAHLLGKASDIGLRAPGFASKTEIDPKEGIGVSMLYLQLKAFFRDCADVLRHLDDLPAARSLEQASTHWLRHSHAHEVLARGESVHRVQKELGHASSATTMAYLQPPRGKR